VTVRTDVDDEKAVEKDGHIDGGHDLSSCGSRMTLRKSRHLLRSDCCRGVGYPKDLTTDDWMNIYIYTEREGQRQLQSLLFFGGIRRCSAVFAFSELWLSHRMNYSCRVCSDASMAEYMGGENRVLVKHWEG